MALDKLKDRFKTKEPLSESYPLTVDKPLWTQTVQKTVEGLLDKTSGTPLFTIEVPKEVLAVEQPLEYTLRVDLTLEVRKH